MPPLVGRCQVHNKQDEESKGMNGKKCWMSMHYKLQLPFLSDEGNFSSPYTCRPERVCQWAFVKSVFAWKCWRGYANICIANREEGISVPSVSAWWWKSSDGKSFRSPRRISINNNSTLWQLLKYAAKPIMQCGGHKLAPWAGRVVRASGTISQRKSFFG